MKSRREIENASTFKKVMFIIKEIIFRPRTWKVRCLIDMIKMACKMAFVYRCKHIEYMSAYQLQHIVDFELVDGSYEGVYQARIKQEFKDWRVRNGLEPVRFLSNDPIIGMLVGFKSKDDFMRFKIAWWV